MLYPSINEIKKKVDSRYTLCILAAKRARDLIDGKPALIDDDIERPVSIAAYEIDRDLVTYSREDSAAAEAETAGAAEDTAEEETAGAVETEAEEPEAAVDDPAEEAAEN